jgi:hypothetical protein
LFTFYLIGPGRAGAGKVKTHTTPDPLAAVDGHRGQRPEV